MSQHSMCVGCSQDSISGGLKVSSEITQFFIYFLFRQKSKLTNYQITEDTDLFSLSLIFKK